MPRGYLDLGITRRHISGWAFDEAHPEKPVRVSLTANGEPLLTVLANRYRGDLHAAGVGDGHHSFDVYLPHPLTAFQRHVIHATIEGSGEALGDSPIVIESADAFDEDVKRSVSGLIAAADALTLDRTLAFLVDQVEAVLYRRADLASHRTLRHFRQRFTRHRGQPRPDEPPPPPLRALVIDERLPQTREDNTVLDVMLSLRRIGYEVTFVPADLRDAEVAERVRLNEAGVLLHAAPYTISVEEVLRRQRGAFDVVIVHGLAAAARYLPMVRHDCPTARAVYLRTASAQAESLSMGAGHLGFLERAQRIQLAEATAMGHADDLLTTDPADAARFAKSSPNTRVTLVPWTVPVSPIDIPFASRAGIALLGTSLGPVTTPAMRPLLDRVIEAVWVRNPAIPFHLPEAVAGRTPQARIVPVVDGIDPTEGVRVALALGPNLSQKIAGTLGAGIPCVATETAAGELAFGRPFPPEAEDTAVRLAEILINLHEDESLNRSAACTGLAEILRERSDACLDEKLVAFLARRRRIR